MEEIRVYAPVMIPTLNRYKHLKACVESLARCSGADKTELYISVDYPPTDKYREGHQDVLDYVNSGIKGFKEVHIYIQEKNLGIGNFKFLREIITTKYDRLILTEDDNVFSPCFLEYINKGLEKFKDNSRVWGICGYNYPIDMPQSYCEKFNYYFSREYSAWGVGYFLERFNIANVERTYDYGKMLLQKHWKHLTWNSRRILIDSLQKKRSPGDLYRTLFLIDTDMYCVFPVENLVVNKGHDGSGINCGYSVKDRFAIQHQSNESHFDYRGNPALSENKSIRKVLNNYFNIPFKSKVRILLVRLSKCFNK